MNKYHTRTLSYFILILIIPLIVTSCDKHDVVQTDDYGYSYREMADINTLFLDTADIVSVKCSFSKSAISESVGYKITEAEQISELLNFLEDVKYTLCPGYIYSFYNWGTPGAPRDSLGLWFTYSGVYSTETPTWGKPIETKTLLLCLENGKEYVQYLDMSAKRSDPSKWKFAIYSVKGDIYGEIMAIMQKGTTYDVHSPQ